MASQGCNECYKHHTRIRRDSRAINKYLVSSIPISFVLPVRPSRESHSKSKPSSPFSVPLQACNEGLFSSVAWVRKHYGSCLDQSHATNLCFWAGSSLAKSAFNNCSYSVIGFSFVYLFHFVSSLLWACWRASWRLGNERSLRSVKNGIRPLCIFWPSASEVFFGFLFIVIVKCMFGLLRHVV